MTREGHHALGAVCGLGTALALGWGPLQAAAAMVISAVTAGGPTSPDVDQYAEWKWLDRVLPDELLGHGGPMQHRGVTHWWGLPALAGIGLCLVPFATPGIWVAWCALIGWMSHLAGDWMFGLAGPDRGPGIPFAPWWRHRGLGVLSSSGWTEGACTVLLGVAALGLGALILRGGLA